MAATLVITDSSQSIRETNSFPKDFAEPMAREKALKDVYDDKNSSGAEVDFYDKQLPPSDIKITGAMKALFIFCGMTGIIYSLINFGIFPAMVWLVAIIFVADMMGLFDKVTEFLRESQRPRGGYTPIEP